MITKRKSPSFKEKNCFGLGAVMLTLGVIMVIFLLVVYLDRCAKVIGLQYQIYQLKETRVALTRQIDRLNLEAKVLSSPERIESLAKSRLGMIKAKEKIVLDLSGLRTGSVNKPLIAARKGKVNNP